MRSAVLLGALIACAALVRSEALLLLPLLAWPVALRGGAGWPLRRSRRPSPASLVIAPWTIRNAIEFGRFVPISNNDSTVLRGANCPQTYSGVDIGFWQFDCIPPRRLTTRPNRPPIWRREGLRYAREHAGRLPVVVPVRILRTLSLYQPRRQVLFAEGRWMRGEQAGGRVVLPARAARACRARSRCAARGRPLLVLLAPRWRSCSSRSWSATGIRGCGTCSSLADGARRGRRPVGASARDRGREGARPGNGARGQRRVIALGRAGEQRPQLGVAWLAFRQAGERRHRRGSIARAQLEHADPLLDRASGLSRRACGTSSPRGGQIARVGFALSASVAIRSWAEKLRAATASHAAPARASTIRAIRTAIGSDATVAAHDRALRGPQLPARSAQPQNLVVAEGRPARVGASR